MQYESLTLLNLDFFKFESQYSTNITPLILKNSKYVYFDMQGLNMFEFFLYYKNTSNYISLNLGIPQRKHGIQDTDVQSVNYLSS